MKLKDEIEKWLPTGAFFRWFQWQGRELYGDGDARVWISTTLLILCFAVPFMIYFSGSSSYRIIDVTNPALDYGLPPDLIIPLILSIVPYLIFHGRIFRWLTPIRERRRAFRMQRWTDEWMERTYGKSDL